MKKDDWANFVAGIDAQKLPQPAQIAAGDAVVAGVSDDKPRADKSDTDCGWIKGLPAGWIDGFICARRLFAGLKSECGNSDPAPWHNVVNAEYWGPHFGKTAEEHAHAEKLTARLVAIIQRAVATGRLAASWFDGQAFKSIPAKAFANTPVVHSALLHGGFEVDPLWPDEWQHWSGHGWAIPKAQFEEWMQGDDPWPLAGLPVSPDAMPGREILAINSRKPSDSGRVSLSEAVTWIAFGIALDSERLERAIQWERLCDGDLKQVQRRIEAASAALLKAGEDGQVSFFGRHVESYGDKGQRTEKIDPLALIDYRQILITGHDHLYYGEGLKRWYQAKNDTHLRPSERRDLFMNVTVTRETLLKHFGSRTDTIAALLMPIPAALPEVGAVMGMEEAVCLLAYGSPSHDTDLWMDRAGNMTFLDPLGAPLAKANEGEKPPHLVAFIEANRRLWTALQSGVLRGFVAPTVGPTLSVPRIYWNPINPEHLEYVYHGITPADQGSGCAVLLSRLAFDKWRGAIVFSPTANTDRAPSVKAGRPPSDDEILAQADKMKAGGLDGRTIAKQMRLEPGFENVATTAVRDLIKGRWKPAGRPKKAA